MKISLDRVTLSEAVAIAGDMSKTWYMQPPDNAAAGRTYICDSISLDENTGIIAIKRRNKTFLTRNFVGAWMADEEIRPRKLKPESAA